MRPPKARCDNVHDNRQLYAAERCTSRLPAWRPRGATRRQTSFLGCQRCPNSPLPGEVLDCPSVAEPRRTMPLVPRFQRYRPSGLTNRNSIAGGPGRSSGIAFPGIQNRRNSLICGLSGGSRAATSRKGPPLAGRNWPSGHRQAVGDGDRHDVCRGPWKMHATSWLTSRKPLSSVAFVTVHRPLGNGSFFQSRALLLDEKATPAEKCACSLRGPSRDQASKGISS